MIKFLAGVMFVRCIFAILDEISGLPKQGRDKARLSFYKQSACWILVWLYVNAAGHL